MGETTGITWTDHTFNPWWGCARVSPGCANCYAEGMAKRTGHDVWGKANDRRRFGASHWLEPVKWNRRAEGLERNARVFCASMADVFEDREDHLDDRARLFGLIGETPNLDWQLLTKRPENVAGMVPPAWLAGCWPSNVWVGTTVEDQARAVERLPHLLALPAPVRFVSAEPLLGPVSMLAAGAGVGRIEGGRRRVPEWVIIGGESGPGHRPLDLDHARALRDECRTIGVPVFFKQVGGYRPTSGGDALDGERIHEFPAPVAR